MKVRHQPRLLRDRAPERIVDLRRVERRETEPLELRHQIEHATDQLAQARPTREIPAIAGDVDAREDHLGEPALDLRAHLRHYLARGYRAVVATAEGDDAESAAVVAALLHLDEAAHAALEAVDEMRRRLPHGHDVVNGDPRAGRAVALHAELREVAEHLVDLGHSGVALGRDLRRATGHDEPCRRVLAPGAPDRLA